MYNEEEKTAYLRAKMGLAEGFVETNTVVPFNESYTECRGHQIVLSTLSLTHNILSVDDFGDVLGNGSIGT